MTATEPAVGAELDAAIAREVFGWSGPTTIGYPNYSTRIESAWTVFETLTEPSIESAEGVWYCTSAVQTHRVPDQCDGWEWFEARGDTAPEAICRAALAAARAGREQS